MSIMRCDKHDRFFDSDFVSECPRCEEEEECPCHTCGKPTPLSLLDGKDDGTGNFNILECEACYGPGWCHA